MDASIGTTPFPTWAIIACAAGGALVLAAAAWVAWRCCCARGRPRPASVSPARPPSAYHPHSGMSGGYSGGYTPSPGGYPASGAASGAWGYAPQHAGGYANGHAAW